MQTKPNPFDYIKSINSKNYMEDISGFNAYITAKVYSVDKNYVFLANSIQLLGSNKLPPRVIYDFYYYSIPKNKRFLRWPKTEKDPKEIEYIMTWFGCNEQVAKDYHELIDKKELKEIINYNEKRGVNKK